ncbi:lateral signaling target protein 2 homolog isoform X2 [Agrilus planipennis]|uniref:Lateral signaling target protein 2 homolog n=1 Tax=Agrilus planipennis TaxID=224129 RepID=A0A1W4WGI7_AGRPL|nr:lateral signaling target protein 2 homolog isoform X2 [Agrilus planipennis]
MESLRKWLYRPKKDDTSLLAQFFYADDDLNIITSELDSFDGRKDPERCTTLVNQLRQAQDKVLTIINAIMDVLIGDERAERDFRVKFPEDVLQDNLAGQLWFGAECLAAGSSIMNKESESDAMRPLAKALTKSLENVRNLLRETCLRSNTPNGPLKLNSNELVTEMLIESLKIFDRLFAEFELSYVSAMVPVKTTQEYELQELIGVLFSETLQRALRMKLLSQDKVDDCDPALMFTIPRLAIVSGLIIFPDDPLCIDRPIEEMSEMFRPFRTLLHKIRELLWTLDKKELYMLEKLLCDNEQISELTIADVEVQSDYVDNYGNRFYNEYPLCKDILSKFFLNGTSKEISTTDPQEYDTTGVHEPKMEEISAFELRSSSESLEAPSTSGYLIANAIESKHLPVLPGTPPRLYRTESPSDKDSLEVISEAAATLSSILSYEEAEKEREKSGHRKSDRHHAPKSLKNKILVRTSLDSPNDSGICTENTSLDRSPSLDLCEDKSCGCSKSSPVLQIPCHCIPKMDNSELEFKSKENASGQFDFSPGCSGKVISDNNNVWSDTKDNPENSNSSSDTSSFNSNCADDEEIALALQAAEIASMREIRAKFSSSEDLIHRLFVCIAGVADQLQTNFASDLRNILKAVFLINASDSTVTTSTSTEHSVEYHPSPTEVIQTDEFTVDPNILAQEALFDSNVYFHIEGEETEADYTNFPRHQEDQEVINGVQQIDINNTNEQLPAPPNNLHHQQQNIAQHQDCERPPVWIPDIEAPKCMSCGLTFTVVKRRHHCRNCGKIFCSRCSSNSVPLPKFGHYKPVRVCNKCFMYSITHFTM